MSSLRNAKYPIGSFTLDNDQRIHDFEPSLMTLAAVALYSTWEISLEGQLVADENLIFKLESPAFEELHPSAAHGKQPPPQNIV